MNIFLLGKMSSPSVRPWRSRRAQAFYRLPSTIYHLAASGEITLNGYAKHVIAQAGRAQSATKIVAEEIARCLPAIFRRQPDGRTTRAWTRKQFAVERSLCWCGVANQQRTETGDQRCSSKKAGGGGNIRLTWRRGSVEVVKGSKLNGHSCERQCRVMATLA